MREKSLIRNHKGKLTKKTSAEKAASESAGGVRSEE